VKLDPALLDILACPNCHSELRVDDAAERLVCTGCGLRYPVRDDIPVMLIDEAEQGTPGDGAADPAQSGGVGQSGPAAAGGSSSATAP
jgi:uncharacterized protein YbaR (Trm112 family)